MKLSKQEQIGLMVIIAVVILALGAFLMVKPKIEDAINSKETMESKQKEYDELADKRSKKDPLRTQILEAYQAGSTMADAFFTEMTPYDADDALREFLENREYTKVGETTPEEKSNILIQEVSVGEPSTETLSTQFYTASQVSYPLKQYAQQGGTEVSASELAVQARNALLQQALGSSQTIGVSTVSFTVYATSQEDLLRFADEANNYYVDEHDTPTRKALAIGGDIELNYPDVMDMYDQMVSELMEKSTASGQAAFTSNTGIQVSNSGSSGTSSSSPQVPTNIGDSTGGEAESDSTNLADYLFTWETSLKFYSIERMQDPTSQLNEQDGITEAPEETGEDE